MRKNDIKDKLILKMIRNKASVEITESIKRLYTTGLISSSELVACVEKGLLDLADYNRIIEGE